MRILWVCNILLPVLAEELGLPYSSREGWLSGLFARLLAGAEDADVTLGIACPVPGAPMMTMRSLAVSGLGDVSFYSYPDDARRPWHYDAAIETRMGKIIEDFDPDLVHIFGTEFPHTLSCLKVYDKPNTSLVTMQGLIGACSEAYMADLPMRVQRRMTLRDFLRQDSLRQQQRKFAKRGVFEREAIERTGHVSGRTMFDKASAEKINSAAVYHPMNETLRSCFYHDGWERENCTPYRIFLSQGDYPLKGFHYMLQAMPAILERYPEATLAVAGQNILRSETWQDKMKRSSYAAYLQSLIQQYHLEEKVTMLGMLSAEEMKEAYLQSHVFVCPSALENSPNSLGEAMLLGLPCVAANVGGIPDMLINGGDGLLYPAGDADALAAAVIEIFEKEDVTARFSGNAKRHAGRTHDADANFNRLLEIYREILA